MQVRLSQNSVSVSMPTLKRLTAYRPCRASLLRAQWRGCMLAPLYWRARILSQSTWSTSSDSSSLESSAQPDRHRLILRRSASNLLFTAFQTFRKIKNSGERTLISGSLSCTAVSPSHGQQHVRLMLETVLAQNHAVMFMNLL